MKDFEVMKYIYKTKSRAPNIERRHDALPRALSDQREPSKPRL
jgi:hypothetical protein